MLPISRQWLLGRLLNLQALIFHFCNGGNRRLMNKCIQSFSTGPSTHTNVWKCPLSVCHCQCQYQCGKLLSLLPLFPVGIPVSPPNFFGSLSVLGFLLLSQEHFSSDWCYGLKCSCFPPRSRVESLRNPQCDCIWGHGP